MKSLDANWLQVDATNGWPVVRNTSSVATQSQQGSAGKPRELPRRSLVHQLLFRGVRMTAQRRLLAGIIDDSSDHLDAATLLQLARKHDSKIDRATVYRTLALLKHLGLVDELDLMHLEGEKHYYEAKTKRDHCHLACFRCGSIVEYTSSAFENLKTDVARHSRFQIEALRLEMGGICERCAKAEKHVPHPGSTSNKKSQGVTGRK